MLDYLETPYFSSLLYELFKFSFEEYKDLVSLNFGEEEQAYHKVVAMIISLRQTFTESNSILNDLEGQIQRDRDGVEESKVSEVREGEEIKEGEQDENEKEKEEELSLKHSLLRKIKQFTKYVFYEGKSSMFEGDELMGLGDVF